MYNSEKLQQIFRVIISSEYIHIYVCVCFYLHTCVYNIGTVFSVYSFMRKCPQKTAMGQYLRGFVG